jgi:hypothetical protein
LFCTATIPAKMREQNKTRLRFAPELRSETNCEKQFYLTEATTFEASSDGFQDYPRHGTESNELSKVGFKEISLRPQQIWRIVSGA